MKKTWTILCILLLLAFAASGCAAEIGGAGQSAVQSAETALQGQEIDLSTLSGPLTIETAGEYTLHGTLKDAVLVDVGSGEVTLHLNGVEIESADTAGIAAASGDKLTIDLVAGSSNTIADGGADEEYDAAVFSYIPLEFTGDGSLTVRGNNNEGISTKSATLTFNGGTYDIVSADDGIGSGGDGGTLTFNGGTFRINASGDGLDSNGDIVFNGGDIFVIGSASGGDAGIDSDGGYVIHGGSLMALGSDMVETPDRATTQNTLALSLDASVPEGSAVKLVKDSGEALAEFQADQAFSTLIFSDPDLTQGEYQLYVDDEAVSVNGETTFSVQDVITIYGGSGGFGGMGGGMPGRMDGEMRGTPPEGAFPEGEGPGTPPDGSEFGGQRPSGPPPEGERPEAPPDGFGRGGEQRGTLPEGSRPDNSDGEAADDTITKG